MNLNRILKGALALAIASVLAVPASAQTVFSSAGTATSTNAVMTAGSTQVGLAQMFGVVTTTAAGPTQAANAKLRITLNANPGAGALRCSVFGRTAVVPSS